MHWNWCLVLFSVTLKARSYHRCLNRLHRNQFQTTNHLNGGSCLPSNMYIKYRAGDVSLFVLTSLSIQCAIKQWSVPVDLRAQILNSVSILYFMCSAVIYHTIPNKSDKRNVLTSWSLFWNCSEQFNRLICCPNRIRHNRTNIVQLKIIIFAIYSRLWRYSSLYSSRYLNAVNIIFRAENWFWSPI